MYGGGLLDPDGELRLVERVSWWMSSQRASLLASTASSGGMAHEVGFVDIVGMEEIEGEVRRRCVRFHRREGGYFLRIGAGTLGSSNARRIDSDLVDAGTRGDKQCFAVDTAEREIGGHLRGLDSAKVLPFGGDDQHAAWTGFIEIAFGVDAKAVGDAGRSFVAQVGEQHAVAERAVLADVVAIDDTSTVDVEISFVRREGEAVGHWHVIDEEGERAALPHEDGIEGQFAAGILAAEVEPAIGIGEVDRPIALDDDVVGGVEVFALVAVSQYRAFAVFLDAHEGAASEGCDNERPCRSRVRPLAPMKETPRIWGHFDQSRCC